MSTAGAAWRRIWPRPATASELCCRTRLTHTCSSSPRGHASPSIPRHLLQLLDRKFRFLSAWAPKTLPQAASVYSSGRGHLRGVRQFGTSYQRQHLERRKPHLYLVLDDHEHAFTIHKLDMDEVIGFVSVETPLRFPEPPLVRLGHPHPVPMGAEFAAIGSHIIATCPYSIGTPIAEETDSGTVTFDTNTAELIVSNALPQGLGMGYDAAIAVGDRLYAFESFTGSRGFGHDYLEFRGGLHCLAAMHCLTPYPCNFVRNWEGWQPLSSQFCWSWAESPPELPFDAKTITAHAVHPRTGTIFVSATLGRVERGPSPCNGIVLRAWVGLHLNSASTNDVDGYLCACSIVSCQRQPNWKVGSDMLFFKHPHWRHVDAKLVYMHERGEYCLVERILPEGAEKMDHVLRRKQNVLRLTTFVLKYDEDGELKIKVCRPSHFYKAPGYLWPFDIQAFWM
ncbi:hypothetical protein ACQ4PT_072161 [Festuca glaucescens]